MTGKRNIRWWLGSDVFCLMLCPPGRGMLSIFLHRLFVVVSEPFFDEHWVDSQDLKDELKSIALIDENKPILVEPHIGKNFKVFEKKKHDGINIAYYHPRTNTRYQCWLYGVDIVEKLRARYSELNWIRLDGTADMSKILPILDIYIRPNRHDGRSRLKEECRLNQIPVIWTNQLNPNLAEICASLDELLKNSH